MEIKIVEVVILYCKKEYPREYAGALRLASRPDAKKNVCLHSVERELRLRGRKLAHGTISFHVDVLSFLEHQHFCGPELRPEILVIWLPYSLGKLVRKCMLGSRA